MILTIIELVIILVGLAVTPVLFCRFPVLPITDHETERFPTVSIIIPARNEEKNLSLLLQDLRAQSLSPYEIICVDDDSSDSTAQIAESYGAALISLHDKPDGWTGKTWACQNGADAATGDLLLFLDADVRLGKNGLRRLMQAYVNSGCTISVQPYHHTKKAYEQLSMLFNLVQIAANGTALPKPRNTGLYGPIILTGHADYNRIGGHKSVAGSIVEDLALGSRFSKSGLAYRLFLGDCNVSFRMYGGGFRALIQGWVKNIAIGALKIPLHIFLLVFIWITSLLSVPLQLFEAVLDHNLEWMAVYSILYAAWVLILYILSRRIGFFRFWIRALYPLSALTVLCVFSVSFFKRIFGLKTVWKNRYIEMEDSSCK